MRVAGAWILFELWLWDWEARHRSPVNHRADSNDRWVILHLQALRVVCQSLEKMYFRLREKMRTLGEHFKHIWNTRKPKTNYQICTFFAGFELKWKTTLLNFMDQRLWHITAVGHGPWKTIGWSSQCTGFVLRSFETSKQYTPHHSSSSLCNFTVLWLLNISTLQ